MSHEKFPPETSQLWITLRNQRWTRYTQALIPVPGHVISTSDLTGCTSGFLQTHTHPFPSASLRTKKQWRQEMAEPWALPTMEIHTEGPTSVLEARQRGHTHTLKHHTLTCTVLSLSLSRAVVPVANHRAAERKHTHTHTPRRTGGEWR